MLSWLCSQQGEGVLYPQGQWWPWVLPATASPGELLLCGALLLSSQPSFSAWGVVLAASLFACQCSHSHGRRGGGVTPCWDSQAYRRAGWGC